MEFEETFPLELELGNELVMEVGKEEVREERELEELELKLGVK